MYSSVALLCAAVVTLLLTPGSHCAPAAASNPAKNCHIWGNYTTGVDMLRKMMVSELASSTCLLCSYVQQHASLPSCRLWVVTIVYTMT